MQAGGVITADVAERLGEFAGHTWTGRDETTALLGSLPQAIVLRFLVESLLRHELRLMVEYKNSASSAAEALLVVPPPATAPREEGNWERATRLDLLEGKDPDENLADVEARFEEAREHYRTLREADAPEEFATARERLADLGRALALARAAMPPAMDEPHGVAGPNAEPDEPAPAVSADTSETAPAGQVANPESAPDAAESPNPEIETRPAGEASADTSAATVLVPYPKGFPMVPRLDAAGLASLGALLEDVEAKGGARLWLEYAIAHYEGVGRSHGRRIADALAALDEQAGPRSAETPVELTPEQRLEALAAGEVSVLPDMSDAMLSMAAGRAFADDWPADIDEAVRLERVRRAAEFDAPDEKRPSSAGDPVQATKAALRWGEDAGLIRRDLSEAYAVAHRAMMEASGDVESAEFGPAVSRAKSLQAALDLVLESNPELMQAVLDEQYAGDGSTAAAEIAPEVADHV